MSEEEIIQGCIAGNRIAQKVFYKKYKGVMYSAALGFVRNKYMADDIIQESMISVFKYLKDFKGECSFKSWLYRIVTNKAINYHNAEKRESLFHMTVEDYLPYEKGKASFEDEYMANDTLYKAMRLLAKSHPMQHTCFRLYYIEGMNHKEIAEDLGIAEVSSRSNTSRACENLRDILTGFSEMANYKASA